MYLLGAFPVPWEFLSQLYTHFYDIKKISLEKKKQQMISLMHSYALILLRSSLFLLDHAKQYA